MPTVISLARVAPDDDGDVLAAWRGAGTLLRALRPDAEYRFVALADGAASPPPLAHETRAGVYDVVHEDGAPAGEEGVTLVDPFEVPPAADAAFVAGWERARELMAARRGYLGTRLHRSPTAPFRFVNVARWSSPLMFFRTLQEPAFREAAAAIGFASHPALYLVVR